MSTALATTPKAAAQPIRISVGTRMAMNNQKASKVNLMKEFAVPDEEGNPKVFRFKDETGHGFEPELPFPMARSHPHFKTNLAAFMAYQKFLRPEIIIFDPVEENEIELDKTMLEFDAQRRLVTLRDEKQDGLLVDMLRRLEGAVGDPTMDTVLLKLFRIAKVTPEKILDIELDADFSIKVLLDKAVYESKRIVLQDGRYYKFPNEDRLVADGEAEMVLKYKTDSGLRAYLDNTAIPVTVLAEQERAGRGRTGKASLDFMSLGESIQEATTQEDGSTLESEAVKFSDDQLRKLIEEGFKGTIDRDSKTGDYLLPGDLRVKTVAEALTFYKTNPDEATRLRDDLLAFGFVAD